MKQISNIKQVVFSAGFALAVLFGSYSIAQATVIFEEDSAFIAGEVVAHYDEYVVLEADDEQYMIDFYGNADAKLEGLAPDLGEHIAVEGFLSHFTDEDVPYIRADEMAFMDHPDDEITIMALVNNIENDDTPFIYDGMF